MAMCCILIAAKYEELRDRVPTIEQLTECSNGTYTRALFQKMEIMVLNQVRSPVLRGRLRVVQLGWRLDCVTTVHFLSLHFHDGTKSSHPKPVVAGIMFDD